MMCFSCLALWATENSFSKRFVTDTAVLYNPIREVGEDLTVGKIILFITNILGARITAVPAAGPDFQSPATAVQGMTHFLCSTEFTFHCEGEETFFQCLLKNNFMSQVLLILYLVQVIVLKECSVCFWNWCLNSLLK